MSIRFENKEVIGAEEWMGEWSQIVSDEGVMSREEVEAMGANFKGIVGRAYCCMSQ